MAMAPTLESYRIDLIEKAMSVDALKFGTFTLKSVSPLTFQRWSPLDGGHSRVSLSNAYAFTIAGALSSTSNPLPQFDVLFGPGYKGIPFAATTVLVLHTKHNIDVSFAYDRKEAKDHGEGSVMVGVPVVGKRVVILDDVMTSGKAVRQAIETICKTGGEVVGVVQALDREEVGQDGVSSTVHEVEGLVGVGRVKAILRVCNLLAWLETNCMQKELESMREYWQTYGLK